MKKQREASKNKDLAKKQSALIKALEGIGDILVYETKQKNRNKRVINGLGRLKDFTQELFTIQREDPERFERLVLSQDFLEYYKKEKEKALVVLSIDPSKYLISFSTAVNQFIKIYESAREANNEEVYRYSVYNLIWMLSNLCKIPGNGLFIEQLLRVLTGIARASIEEDDTLLFSSSTSWYVDIAFSISGKSEILFDLSYLYLFDRYFFSIARYAVSLDRYILFEILVSKLVDGIHIPSYDASKIWDYGHLVLRSDFEKANRLDKEYDIEDRVIELYKSQEDIFEINQLKEWLNRFQELEDIIDPNLSREQEQESEVLKEKIRGFVYAQYKYNDLLENVFSLAAFCLREQRLRYIKCLWEYKQPPDANGKWVGHDIVPETTDSLISFYFKKGLFEREPEYFDGHHGSEIYYKKYFLLLLARMLQSTKTSLYNDPRSSPDVRLPYLNVYRLSNIEYSIDGLEKIAIDMQQQKELFKSLGFRMDELEDTFSRLAVFLSLLKTKAKERIGELLRSRKLSEEKLGAFKDNVCKGFCENAVMRNIIRRYGRFEDKTQDAYTGDLKRIGRHYISDKAAFFNEWHVHYIDWGKDDGRAIADEEDSIILKVLFKVCRHVKNMDLSAALSTLHDISDIVIITCNVDPNIHFNTDDNYIPRWQISDSDHNNDDLLSGYYFRDKKVPVYCVYPANTQEAILILNKSSMGNLIQYSPDGDEMGLKYEIFYINVEAYSDNDELINEHLVNPPDWLKEFESEKDREDFLRGKVRIQIYERFEYTVAGDECGLILTRIPEEPIELID